MIADRFSGREVQSTIQGDVARMSIDESAMAHIMQILTDLYSDPELAVIREYSTNAWDAHREAGQTLPIQVTLPTPLSPFLRIKDFGVGLSVEDIHNIYCKYGASTKRETNEQVGMLGLGCKSALTYSDQFSVVAVKNGTRITVSVSRDEESASMTVVDTLATDESDGVEIVIPVKRENGIEAKANNFFKFWPEGSVLVNGASPKRFTGLKLYDDLYLSEERQSYVVMGHVAYPIDHDELPLDLDKYRYNDPDFGIVAFLPIGSVHFTPNREALHYTAKTKAALAQVAERVKAGIVGAVQREVDTAANHVAAVLVMNTWHNKLPSGLRPDAGSYTYRGSAIPTDYSPDGGIITVPLRGRALSQSSKMSTVTCDYWPKAAWFYGYDPQSKFTASRKRKLLAHMAEKGYDVQTFMLVSKQPDLPWIDTATVFDWADVNSIKLDRAVSSNLGYVSHITGAYKGWDHTGKYHYERTLQASDIDTTKLVLYADTRAHDVVYVKEVLDANNVGYTLCVMPSTRVAKFQRDFPKAMHYRQPVQALYDKWAKSVTDEQMLALAIQDASDTARVLCSLDPTRIDDPELVRQIKLARMDLTKLIEKRKVFSNVGLRNQRTATWDDALAKYPLIAPRRFQSGPAICAHTFVYINAAYAADKEAN